MKEEGQKQFAKLSQYIKMNKSAIIGGTALVGIAGLGLATFCRRQAKQKENVKKVVVLPYEDNNDDSTALEDSDDSMALEDSVECIRLLGVSSLILLGIGGLMAIANL